MEPPVPVPGTPLPTSAAPATPAGGGTPATAAPGSVPVAPGAPAAVSPGGAPAAQPTAAPAGQPLVDPRDAKLAELQAKYQAELAKSQRLEPYAQIGYQQVQQRGQQQVAAPVTAPVAPEPKKSPFNIPAFDKTLQSFIDYDAQGRVIEKPGAPPGTAAAYQQHLNGKAAALDQFLADPKAVLTQLIDIESIRAEAVKEAEKNLHAKVMQAQHAQAEEQIFAANKSWLCQTDAAGNPAKVQDPLTGEVRYQFTPDGNYYLQHYQALVKAGHSPDQADYYAKSAVAFARATEAHKAGQSPATVLPGSTPAPAPAAPAQPDLRQAFLNSLPGGAPQGHQPANPDVRVPAGPTAAQTARQFMLDRFKAAGAL